MKRAQFSFVWLFALIVGGAILALALYGATKSSEVGEFKENTFKAKSFEILTDPLQAGFSDAASNIIEAGSKVKIEVDCSSIGFGESSIQISSRRNSKWSEAGLPISAKNKYFFSEKEIIGDEIIVFSAPFYFPFKIADLTVLIAGNYCFENIPGKLKNKAMLLKSKKTPKVTFQNCQDSNSKIICFNNPNCDINVLCNNADCESGQVVKNSGKIGFADGLLFPAIFSDKETYECNVKRLGFRASKIAEILKEKADRMSARGCSLNIQGDLNAWKDRLIKMDSQNIADLIQQSKEIEKKNSLTRCRLW